MDNRKKNPLDVEYTSRGNFLPRSYKHISNYEKEILELKSEWLTLSENGIRIWWNNRIIVNIRHTKTFWKNEKRS